MINLDFCWGTGDKIKAGVEELASRGYLKIAGGNILILNTFYANNNKGFMIDKVGKSLHLAYKTTSDFYFALSLILAHSEEYVYKVEGRNAFDGVYALIDCSRNAVRKVDSIKDLIVKLVLSGYKGMYLYMEDTFEIENEPYFGYQRGRYTQQELKEIVEFAHLFDFEIIPAIQTLAHLTTMLRWDTYYEIADTSDILMVGNNRVYSLIDNMLSTLEKVFKGGKINLGMDEAHYIGLGSYLNKNGYRDRKELMTEHIRKVMDICKKHNFTDLRIWSDMLIKKYDKNEQDCTTLYNEIMKGKEGISLTPVFWDYYETDYEFYNRVMKAHKKLAKNSIFTCGGGYTWFGFTPLNRFAEKINEVAVKCAKDNNINELVVACWGDGGAEASLYSGMASLISCGCYNYCDDNKNLKDDISKVATDYNFSELMAFDLPNLTYDINSENEITSSSKYLLYGDILNGTFEKNINEKFPDYYQRAIDILTPISRDNRQFVKQFSLLLKLSELLKLKVSIQLQLRRAYQENNRDKLQEISFDLKQLIALSQDFYNLVDYQWQSENKQFGNEAMDVKLGAVVTRTKRVIKVIEDYLSGRIDKISELENNPLPYMTIANYDFVPDNKEKCNMVAFCFHELTTAGIF